MGHREAVGRTINISAHFDLQIDFWPSLLPTFPNWTKPQISVLPNLPSPFHPPTSNLKSLANCWPRQLSLQRSLWSSDILYKYPWAFPGWHRTPLGSLAAILPQRGRVKKNLNGSAGVNGTFKTWIWWNPLGVSWPGRRRRLVMTLMPLCSAGVG